MACQVPVETIPSAVSLNFKFPDWEAVIKSRFSSVLMLSLAAPVAEPTERRSPAVVRRTMEPSSVIPGLVEEEEMVSFLLVVSVERETSPPAAKVKVSVLELAENSVEPTLIVLKIFWLEPGSVLSIVIVWSPVIAMPVPAAALYRTLGASKISVISLPLMVTS